MIELEQRLRALEDRAEVLELIARYGPLADAGDGDALAELWADGGRYSFDTTSLERSELAGLVELASHRELMAAGCAHVLSAPTLRFDGDTAAAVNHSVVLARRGDNWAAVRVSANHWRLVRTERGWRVAERTNRLLSGGESARELLRA